MPSSAAIVRTVSTTPSPLLDVMIRTRATSSGVAMACAVAAARAPPTAASIALSLAAPPRRDWISALSPSSVSK